VMDLGAREICNVYGLTECYGNCSVTDAHDAPEVRRTTVGYPLPGMEIRVVDRESRKPLPAGEIGEVLVRGHLTPGYYRDPEKNAAAFDGDGFLLTGDLGFIGADGRLRFRGRIKEMIKTGGINVAPLEVEEVLLGHPAVEQAYVVGLSDPRKEEILVAVVVAKPGRDADPAALRALCRDALAAYKVPQEIYVMTREDLPVTSTGKVQKFRLAEQLAAARS
jgi:fatty-acyl-CoA synthase